MSMQEYNEAMIYKIMYEQFMNQVQVINNLYAEYDRDTLSLLDDANYGERVARLRDVSKAYIEVSLEILETESLIERNEERIKKAKELKLHMIQEKWEDAQVWNYIWLNKQKALKQQAKSQYAMFRNMALVQAYEQKKKRGGILGLGSNAVSQMKQKLAMARKQKDGKTTASDKKMFDKIDEKIKENVEGVPMA